MPDLVLPGDVRRELLRRPVQHEDVGLVVTAPRRRVAVEVAVVDGRGLVVGDLGAGLALVVDTLQLALPQRRLRRLPQLAAEQRHVGFPGPAAAVGQRLRRQGPGLAYEPGGPLLQVPLVLPRVQRHAAHSDVDLTELLGRPLHALLYGVYQLYYLGKIPASLLGIILSEVPHQASQVVGRSPDQPLHVSNGVSEALLAL